jgi:hypothetical protein
MDKSKIVHQIRRLVIASDSFHHCVFLLEHMRDEKIDGSSNLFPCMMSGVVVTYAKNFNQADGLGPLPSLYTKFPNTELDIAHAKLMNSRNTVYAHRDEKSHTFQDSDGSIHNYPVNVVLDSKQGQFLFGPYLVDIAYSKIPDILSLLRFQLERLQTDLDSKLLKVVDHTKNYEPDTDYILGVSFP